MFWGLSMEPQKRYTQVVSESFHISQAAVDVSSVEQESSPTQVILEFESNDFLLATLSKNARIFQVPLDLNFMKGDHVSFRTVGPGIVHLSGYHVFDDDDDLESRLLGADDSDDEEIDESMETSGGEDSISAPPGKRKKAQTAAGKSKKSKLESESEDDDDDEDDTLNSSARNSLLDLEAEEDSDEDDEEEEEEEDDDDDEENGDLDEEEEDDSDSMEQDSDEEEEEIKVKTKKGKQVNGTASPATKKVNKNLLNNSKKDVKTPKSEAKSDKKSLNQSKQEKTPKQDKTPKQEKTPKGANANTPSAGSPKQKKVLEGGVIAEDLKVGEGPVAKPGKMAQVYYVGRLKSNNKQFDATSGGPGFKFRLGRGEVIRGWDVGVAGMKVGGKRRLTVPAGLAYGAKGQPPTIPPNATLVFDVELRGIS